MDIPKDGDKMAANVPAGLRDNKDILAYVDGLVGRDGYHIKATDLDRPWGGFYALEENDARAFADKFFPDLAFETYENLSPKFLMVAPGLRLSWQYHDRRAELWRILRGPVGVKISPDDTEPEVVRELAEGETIQFDAQVRHRLIGLTANWGVVAEIWKHTDPTNLSAEDDIVRVQDDFKR